MEIAVSETAAMPLNRLNPKLTRRAPPPTNDVPIENEIHNPRAGLLHSGQWITKQFDVGRWVKGTGIWSCCGSMEHLSLYCSSLDARKAMLEQKTIQGKKQLALSEYKEKVENEVKGPWERGELGSGEKLEKLETAEERALREANIFGNPHNAPMLVSWVYKHLEEELTLQQGLNYIRKHVETGEGCVLMHRHDIMMCLLKVYDQNKTKPAIVLYVICILRKMLDCNFTRDKIIDGDGPGFTAVTALRLSFSILHSEMKSASHVTEAIRCIMQCSRSEVCRQDIIQRTIISYVQELCKMYSKNAEVLRCSIRLFNWTANTSDKLVYLCEIGCVVTVLKCMQRHLSDHRVVSPGIQFLSRASKNIPKAAVWMLKHKAIGIVIGAVQALYSEEILQLEGLKLLQMMARTTDGWNQISAIKGGWQTICQGTAAGDALVHDLQGELHNPGWCIGDTHHLPVMARAKLAATEAAASITRAAPKAAWTSHSLKQFMGLSMKAQTLAINNEYDEVYFELLSTLDMLPRPGEEREYYFIRLDEYEKESDISVEEMAHTMIEMKKAAELKAKQLESNEETGEYIKPIYFMGERYSSTALDEADVNIVEELQATILKEENDDEQNVTNDDDSADD